MQKFNRGWQGSVNRMDPPGNRRASRHKPNILTAALAGIAGLVRLLAVGLWRLVYWFIRYVLRQKGLVRKLVLLAVVGGFVMFIFGGILFAYYAFTLPDPDRLVDREIPESTKILDRNGESLYEIFAEEKRTLVRLEEIPDHVQKAAIAVEDRNFYKHGGISFMAIARSAVVNVFAGSRAQGGSTITQQFVKNAVLTREKIFSRKFKEIVMSLQLERKYSKDEILQLYFNEIPYGSTLYGVEAASRNFFDKSARDLTLLEGAYLAAIPQAPTYYSPYGPNRLELDQRADTVLQLMYEQGYIDETERSRAQNEEVTFRTLGNGIIAPHFVLYVQDILAEKYGELALQEGGFKVTTTLDLEMQKMAEEAVAAQAEKNEQNFNATNAALVAVDPKTGQILAMVGSRDFFNEEIDGAVNVALRPRQPGSSFKPYVYATAFKEGMNPATMLVDVVTNFGSFGGRDYIPKNFNFQEYGPVSVRQALAGSLNIPAVKTLILAGVSDAIDTAESMGITTLKDRSRFGPSLVLGGGEVKLLDHVSAFGVFANNGIRHEPVSILKIEDKKGRVLEEYKESRGREVLDPQIAYQINHILSDNAARAYVFGANNNLTLPGRPVAAKTGTTQESKDAWTMGYTPSLAAGVWAGNNDGAPMKGAGGSSAAAPIWNQFMRNALAGQGAQGFSRPAGIVEVAVDSLSGKLPTQYSPSTKTEVFASFNVPKEEDDVHIPVTVDGQTRVFTVLHSEMPNQPAWEEPVRRWADAHGFPLPPSGSEFETDKSIDITISAASTVSALPWIVNVQVKAEEQVDEIELFLDGVFLQNAAGNFLNYQSGFPQVDGRHRLTARARTAGNKSNSKTAEIAFDTGHQLLLVSPENNRELTLPANLTLTSSIDAPAQDIAFVIRSVSGSEQALAGNVSKQKSGDIYFFTLNWSQDDSPPAGSYALYGQIGNVLSPEINIKIQ